MPRPLKTDRLDRLDRKRLVRDIDPLDATHRLAKDVIPEDQAFVTEPQERGVHPHRLVHHVQPRDPGERVGDPLLPPGLHVGQF